MGLRGAAKPPGFFPVKIVTPYQKNHKLAFGCISYLIKIDDITK
jgi:hypothetical protein